MPDYRALIVTDSIGQGIQEELDELIHFYDLQIEVSVDVLSGARLLTATNQAISASIADSELDLILILAGVNNLSNKHSSRRVTPIYHESQHLLHSLSNQFTHAQQLFLNHAWVPKLIFGYVCGIHLMKYNTFKTGSSPDYTDAQIELNRGVIQLNQTISVLNNAVDSIAPWTSDEIHYYRNNKHTHKYNKLFDGLHPCPTLISRWSYLILKSICLNLSIECAFV